MPADSPTAPARGVGSKPNFLDRFAVAVDREAAPVDVQEVLADFLVRFVEKRAGGSPKVEHAPDPQIGGGCSS
jgi:hypothetical protein